MPNLGKYSYANKGAAIGHKAQTEDGVALGLDAQTLDNNGNFINAIQIGTGVNSEEGTVQFYQYKLLDNLGKIIKERIPSDIDATQVIIEDTLMKELRFTSDPQTQITLNAQNFTNQLNSLNVLINKQIQDIINNFINYYTKEQTYNKQEVLGLVNTIKKLEFKEVLELPEIGDSNIIYLVKLEGDTYSTLFIWVDSKWKDIGTTNLDYEDFYTKLQVNKLLSDLQTSVNTSVINLTNSLKDYYTKNEITNLVNNLTYLKLFVGDIPINGEQNILYIFKAENSSKYDIYIWEEESYKLLTNFYTKEEIDAKLITSGEGTKFLSDDGTYKEVKIEESGTIVTLGGVAQTTWDADSKQDVNLTVLSKADLYVGSNNSLTTVSPTESTTYLIKDGSNYGSPLIFNYTAPTNGNVQINSNYSLAGVLLFNNKGANYYNLKVVWKLNDIILAQSEIRANLNKQTRANIDLRLATQIQKNIPYTTTDIFSLEIQAFASAGNVSLETSSDYPVTLIRNGPFTLSTSDIIGIDKEGKVTNQASINEEFREKTNIIILDEVGDKYLSNDGTYKIISSSGGSAITILVNGASVNSLSFTSDPQTQIDEINSILGNLNEQIEQVLDGGTNG